MLSPISLYVASIDGAIVSLSVNIFEPLFHNGILLLVQDFVVSLIMFDLVVNLHLLSSHSLLLFFLLLLLILAIFMVVMVIVLSLDLSE